MEWTIVKKISQGSFGIVSEIRTKSGESYALKEAIDDENDCENNESECSIPESIFTEINLLNRLSHPNIIKLIDIQKNSGKYQLILELADMDLKNFIKSERYDIGFSCALLHQLLTGVHYLHSNNIIHRDLKPENILIKEYEIKICDFGTSCYAYNEKYYFHEPICTLNYRAPEILMEIYGYCTKAMDMWSVGCIFGELVTRNRLFYFLGEDHAIQIICLIFNVKVEDMKRDGGFFSFLFGSTIQEKRLIDVDPPTRNTKEYLGDKLKNINNEYGLDLFQKLLEIHSEKRINAQDALNHPFFL